MKSTARATGYCLRAYSNKYPPEIFPFMAGRTKANILWKLWYLLPRSVMRVQVKIPRNFRVTKGLSHTLLFFPSKVYLCICMASRISFGYGCMNLETSLAFIFAFTCFGNHIKILGQHKVVPTLPLIGWKIAKFFSHHSHILRHFNMKSQG